MTSRKFYILLLISIFAGYIWLGFNLAMPSSTMSEAPGVCIFKSITGFPCPSCGSTRSVLHIVRGEFAAAIMINPIGGLIGLILVLGPLWIAYDLLFKHQTLWLFYQQFEKTIRKKSVAIPFILLVASNWAWNIVKGL